MTQKTWDAFLKTMNNDPNTIVLDLTKKENTEKENLVNKFDNLFYKLGEKDISKRPFKISTGANLKRLN